MTPQQLGGILLAEHQSMSIDPTNTIEVAVEQRLVGLFSAAVTLKKLSRTPDGRAVIKRQSCMEDLEQVRDQLSNIIDDIGRAAPQRTASCPIERRT